MGDSCYLESREWSCSNRTLFLLRRGASHFLASRFFDA